MLQAVKMDAAPAQPKVRSNQGSDPSETAFAGLMTQAALAASTPAAPPPEPPGEEPKVDTRSAESKCGRGREVREKESCEVAKEARKSEECDDDPDEAEQAKAACSTQEAKGTCTPQTVKKEGASNEPPNLAVAGSLAPDKMAPQPVTPAIQAEQAELPPVAADPAPKVDASVQAELARVPLAKAAQGTRPEAPAKAKTTLTELTFIPAPSTPETPKVSLAGISKPEPGEAPQVKAETRPEAKLPDPQKEPEAAPAKPLVADEGRLSRPELPAPQSAKQAAPAMDTAPVALAEGAARTTQTAAPATTVSAARPSPVFAQVEGSIRWILQNKVQGAELQLHPESLGRMVIQLRVEGQEVHARLWASEATSLALLQDHKTFLQASLREQGLTLGSFDLQSGARGDGTPQDRPGPSLPTLLQEAKQEMPSFPVEDPALSHRIEVFA